MAKKRYTPEQSYYRWRREYGGLTVDQAKRLKDLERENARLKKLVADQALDMAILPARGLMLAVLELHGGDRRYSGQAPMICGKQAACDGDRSLSSLLLPYEPSALPSDVATTR